MTQVLRWAVAALTIGVALAANSRETVLPEAAVTEKALIEALSSDPDTGEEPAVRSRGFKPAVRAGVVPTVPGTSPAAGEPRRASLLVTFVVDSSELTRSAKLALDVAARAMQSERLATRVFVIEGHADPRGSEKANRDLSQARAESVVAYLVAAHGLPRDRLTAVGLGAQRLMNQEDPTAAENRRVTIVAR